MLKKNAWSSVSSLPKSLILCTKKQVLNADFFYKYKADPDLVFRMKCILAFKVKNPHTSLIFKL